MSSNTGCSRHLTRVTLAYLGALCASGCSASAPAPHGPTEVPQASTRRSGAADRQRLAVTVYNSNFALVREERQLALGVGRVSLAYEDVSAHIQPETLVIRSLTAPDGLVVLEQNYRYDLLGPQKLLEKYVGRQLKVARYNQRLGRDEIKDAELLSVQNGIVLRIDGEIVTATDERFIFPQLPDELHASPTLVWLLDSTTAEQKVEVSYLTQNLSWHADYVLVLNADETQADLAAWVTLDNQSGTAFDGAELRLVAGAVQHLAPAPPPMPMAPEEEGQVASGRGSAFSQEALFEYHLYALQRPTDLRDKEQKQLSLLDAHAVALNKQLVLRGSEQLYRSRSGEVSRNQQVSVLLRIENSEARGLGLPLPQGVWRVYKADASGAQQFVGEDSVEHTPRDEKIELALGEAFDVVADRRQLEWRAIDACSSESDWEIALRNHKQSPVEVEVLEPAQGEWTIIKSSHPAQTRDANSFAFSIGVPARGATKLTYRVRVRWC
jgi:hypothetical protein